MRRRAIIAGLGGVLLSLPQQAGAQRPAKVLRLGLVSAQPRSAPNTAALLERMAELGYEDGRNLVVEYVQAANLDAWEAGYRELATRKVDILVAPGPEVALKAALATANANPIVMIAIDYDPLALGYVASFARPGGNVTGVFLQQIELTAKRLQIVRDVFPDARGATVFWDRASADQWEAARSVAATLELQLAGIQLREPPYDYEQAIASAPPGYRRNLVVMNSPYFFRDRARLADFALRSRIPSNFALRQFVEAGGLMSYGPSITAMYRRAAEYVDRIARGARPADLPIEQPTRFELAINVRTAKRLGLAIPPAILARADEVIE
jgi:putative ABC transport system substrate-binding protein